MKRIGKLCLLPFFFVGTLLWAGLYLNVDFVLSEKLREVSIENPASDTLFFARPVAIRHDKENVYVLDSIDCEIRVFSKTGSFCYSIGKKGQGPAEFIQPNDFCLFNDNIFVSDAGNMRIQVLDRKGKYLRGFRTLHPPRKILVLDEKNIIISHLPRSNYEKNKKEYLVQCFAWDGSQKWEAIEALRDDDYAVNTMINDHFLIAGFEGAIFLRKCNDPKIHFLDKKGVVKSIIIDKKYHLKTIAVKTRRGETKELTSLCWSCDINANDLYLLDSEFIDNDLKSGKKVVIINRDGHLRGLLEFPSRLRKISIDGNQIYVIDSEYKLRYFKVDK